MTSPDPIIRTVEVKVPEVRVDSLWFVIPTDTTRIHDTVRIDNGRIHIKVVHHHDSVYVEGKCDPEKVLVEVPCGDNITVGYSKWQLIGSLIAVSMFWLAVLCVAMWVRRK